MEQSTNVVRLRQLDDVDDPLTEVLRAGARQLLAQAVELEVEDFLAERAALRLPDGRARLVRHGHAAEREVQTGIGAVVVSRPKVRDDEVGAWRDGAGRKVRLRLLPALDRITPGFPGWPHERHGPPGRSTRVVLATAHLDHDPFNNVPENLAALCQRCHILHDKAEHLRRRRLTYLARRALGDLFTGPYREA